jgi:hypothetical protein
MDENFKPLDSLVNEIMGNAGFLDRLLTKTRVIWGIVGIIGIGGLLVVIALLLK